MADAVAAEHRVVRAKRLWDRRPLRDWYPPGYAALRSRRHDAGSFYRGLVEYIDGLDVRPREGDWSGYVQSPDATVGAPGTYDGKQRAVDAFLGRLSPGRVLDVGANLGWFSELAVHHGHDVTAVDTDDPTSSALFARAQAHGLPILPLRMDIMWPTPGHGMALAYAPAPGRLRSGISLWLAIVHHLARSGYSFEAVARTVADFTEHAAIIEFVPRDDPHIAAWPLVRDPGYDQERFIEAMRPQFPNVEVMPSSPDPRIMMLFRRA
jgi:SAM-dependent methyltransferase